MKTLNPKWSRQMALAVNSKAGRELSVDERLDLIEKAGACEDITCMPKKWRTWLVRALRLEAK